MKLRAFMAVCMLALILQPMKSQTTDDFGIWTMIGVEKSLGRKWSLQGDVDFRTRENSTEVNRWAVKLGGEYKIIKNLKAGLFYHFLYIHDLEYDDYQPRHRVFAYLQGKQKWGRFSFILRERFQLTDKDDSDRIKSSGKIDTYKIDRDWYWRSKLRVEYDIRKSRFQPSASVESFFQLNNPDGNKFDALRYTLTMGYKLNKQGTFNLSGIHDHEMNVKKPMNRYIVEIGYVHSF